MRSQCWSVEKSREHALPAKKGQVPGKIKRPYRGDCLTTSISSFGNNKFFLKNDCAQHNELGVSFVGQVVWNTEPIFFFFEHFVFFSRARVGLVKKKVRRNIENKAHGLILCHVRELKKKKEKRKKTEMYASPTWCTHGKKKHDRRPGSWP